MRRIWIALCAGVGLLALFVAFLFGVSEAGGEVVTLETRDAAGELRATRLWVVDHEGYAWLRSGAPESGWFQRLEANPSVSVTRGGVKNPYLAQPVRDPGVRDAINASMLDKYGFAERVIAATRDGTGSIPIRLVPQP